MKYLIFILAVLAMMWSGCASSNKMEDQSTEETKGNMDSSYEIGKVYLNRDGCEIFIVTEGENSEKLYPVGLNDVFKVNNAILQFEYDLSRAPLPQGCEQCRTVVLRNVTRVKR